ncbi:MULTISPECIES: hypothetical protein [Tsukamurella]|uniref:Uncharacterized protein n=1 Tax=Tsukamurella strandjordii TaxID=147577 RepID=A0AA90SIG7_9ACTN|nr:MULTISPECIES: hypothetical protein [Tsukamurella]MDP0400029.1 hypothetical protein [Tsukamurella strandjordii]GIZ97045.1 hypothetical protein TTY48_16570 [Tsukamurella sp. TY48]
MSADAISVTVALVMAVAVYAIWGEPETTNPPRRTFASVVAVGGLAGFAGLGAGVLPAAGFLVAAAVLKLRFASRTEIRQLLTGDSRRVQPADSIPQADDDDPGLPG